MSDDVERMLVLTYIVIFEKAMGEHGKGYKEETLLCSEGDRGGTKDDLQVRETQREGARRRRG